VSVEMMGGEMEHEDKADALEAETEDMEALSGQLSEQIESTRSEWDSKKSATDVPGAMSADDAAPGGYGVPEEDTGGDEGENFDAESGGPA
jgi:hypothetical protein